MELIHKDLTHDLIGCFFHVHNTLGVGYDEKTYHKALECHFKKIGIEHFSKERKILIHRGCQVRSFEADFVISGRIILELKTIQSRFIQKNYVQILSELKLWKLHLGLLVNFGLQKVEFERIPFTEKSKAISENYDYIKDCITDSDRKVLAKLRDSVLYVFDVHGLGYGGSVYRKLIETELNFQQIKYQNKFPIKVNYEGEMITEFKMKPILVENRIICAINALEDKIDFYDIAKTQSYLRALGLKVGIIVNIGKIKLEIRGISA